MKKHQSSLFVVPIGVGSICLASLAGTDCHIIYPIYTIFVLVISFLYFLTDFIMMIARYKQAYRVYFLHHVLGIMSIPIIYFKLQHLTGYLIAFLSFEISTPFMYLAKGFHKKRMAGNGFGVKIAYYASMLVFVASFVSVRVMYGTYMLYDIWPKIMALEYPYVLIISMPLCLQIMNYVWFYRLVRLIVRAIYQ